MKSESTSSVIAKELLRKCPNNTKVVNMHIYHERTVRNYIMGIEDAHKKAAKSKLFFPCGCQV